MLWEQQDDIELVLDGWERLVYEDRMPSGTSPRMDPRYQMMQAAIKLLPITLERGLGVSVITERMFAYHAVSSACASAARERSSDEDSAVRSSRGACTST